MSQEKIIPDRFLLHARWPPMLIAMEIRVANMSDLAKLIEIDGTVESTRYLHLDHSAEGMSASWRIEERAARQKLIDSNRLSDETLFVYKQIISGADEGAAMVIELNESLAAAMVAEHRPASGTLHIVDLRVDYDQRRQG